MFLDSSYYLSPIYCLAGTGRGDEAKGETVVLQKEYCANYYAIPLTENVLYVLKYANGQIEKKKVLLAYCINQETFWFVSCLIAYQADKMPDSFIAGTVLRGTGVLVRMISLVDSLDDSYERINETGTLITKNCYQTTKADTIRVSDPVDSVTGANQGDYYKVSIYVNVGYLDADAVLTRSYYLGGASAAVRPIKTGLRQTLMNVYSTVAFDVLGRKITANRAANGLNLIRLPNGAMVKKMNLNRQYR
jgi:hypothetical protein